VGTESDTQCTEWFIEPRAKGIGVADIAVNTYLDLPIGRVDYNMQRPREVTPRFVVPLTRSRQSEWMPYLDLLVYCTRRQTLRLPEPGDRGYGVYHHHHDLHFPPDAKGDGE